MYSQQKVWSWQSSGAFAWQNNWSFLSHWLHPSADVLPSKQQMHANFSGLNYLHRNKYPYHGCISMCITLAVQSLIYLLLPLINTNNIKFWITIVAIAINQPHLLVPREKWYYTERSSRFSYAYFWSLSVTESRSSHDVTMTVLFECQDSNGQDNNINRCTNDVGKELQHQKGHMLNLCR